MCVCVCVGGGIHSLYKQGRDVPTKGSYFQSLSGTGMCVIDKNLGNGGVFH